MNSTNRLLNRGLLLIAGLLLAAVGAVAVVAGTRPTWADAWLRQAAAIAESGLADLRAWTVVLPGGLESPAVVLVAIAAAVAAVVLLLVFVFTRGRGNTKTVLRLAAADGATTVDRSVADAVLARALADRTDVLSARVGAYRVRGAPSIELVVTARRGADLARILGAADEALADWDELAGSRIPVMLHLSDRSRFDRWRSSTRVS